jgi:hypothetical protein
MRITHAQYLVLIDGLMGSLKISNDRFGFWNYDEATRQRILNEVINLQGEVEVET